MKELFDLGLHRLHGCVFPNIYDEDIKETISNIVYTLGVVGYGEGVVYLTSPTDIGLHWARPAILVAGEVGGGMFLLLLFLHFHSCSSFFSVPLFNLLFYLFSPLLWEMTQNDLG